jgi:hypothetical protein
MLNIKSYMGGVKNVWDYSIQQGKLKLYILNNIK